MPIYEYQCSDCGHHLEALQKFSDEPLKECPKCHQQTLNKLVSATTFQLKGTGWYATDFRDKGKPKPAEKTQDASGEKSSSGTETKTNTKSTKDNEGAS